MALNLRCLYDPRMVDEFEDLRNKIEDPSLLTAEELDDLALLCLADLETYSCIMFLAVEGYRFKVRPFHRVLFDVLERVRYGEFPRLIINMPPGFGKTHIFKMWCSQSIQREPRCKFLHLSASEQLVNDNSDEIKMILNTPIARAIRDVGMRTEARGKALWKTRAGGVFRAAPAGGQVTGFRAGRLGFYREELDWETVDWDSVEVGNTDVEAFCGAAVLDDLIKPDDATSNTKRARINERLPNTIASRLATERVPIVLIMQRIDGLDPAGFLLGGGSGEKWHHLIIPDIVKEEDLDPSQYKEYAKDWLYGIPIQHNLPLGPIWPEKLDETKAAAKKAADEVTYMSQYRQRPVPRGGRMFMRDWFPKYQELDGWNNWLWVNGVKVSVEYYHVYVDTAQKTGQQHDWTSVQLYAKGSDGRIYLIDMLHGKYTAPELYPAVTTFLNRYEYRANEWGMSWRYCKIEDKVSGTGLIQTIEHEYEGRIEPIGRNADKYVRACDAQARIKSGKVVLPESALWLEDFLSEVESFSRDLNHEFDDQCDTLFDAVSDMIDAPGEADYGQFRGNAA
jgi:predicted phage terminase large subunit-like protein